MSRYNYLTKMREDRERFNLLRAIKISALASLVILFILSMFVFPVISAILFGGAVVLSVIFICAKIVGK
jgi:hypothetical protein